MDKKFINEMRFLSGMEPLEESVAFIVPREVDEEAQALSEATVSINKKLKDAEWSFLGNVLLVTRQYLRKQHKGLRFEVDRLPAMGGKGSIGGIRLTGDNWQIDAVISRKGDSWEFWKSGSMSVGISSPVTIKDTAKVSDIHPESVAMGITALYGGLVEKNEDARQRAS